MYSKEKILEIDKKHIWHPFTQMKDYENSFPKVISRGKGIKIYDIDGNEYYDTISSWWTNTLGHSNERINNALKKQLENIEHVNFSGFTHPYAAEFIDRLKNILDSSFSRYFFSDDGSTAVEVAIKMAFQYWQNIGNTKKTKFIMMENAYHGDTLGAVSVGGVPLYHKLYSPLMFSSIKADSPDCARCPHRKSDFTFDASETGCDLQCFDSMEKALKRNAEEAAGVIVEPLIQAAGGMLVYKKEYLQKLRKLCSELGILLIFDEVATGFGRTGTMFAYEQASVIPDIITLSKGITAGYMPLSITAATEKIYEAFYDDYFSYKTFFHGHSYTANPLACAAGIENLKILEEEKLPYSNRISIDKFHEKLKEFREYDYVGDIRFTGFIGAIDIVRSRKNGEIFDPKTRIGKQIYEESLENGLVLRPLGDMIYYFLPLITTEEDLEAIFAKSKFVIEKVINANK